ncbi:MAG TPA: hypothetical protein ENJ84_15395 [Gammaproteobacteria bacterium]|nr:hypothetical protein [Gammaproteobacteria bacterium]
MGIQSLFALIVFILIAILAKRRNRSAIGWGIIATILFLLIDSVVALAIFVPLSREGFLSDKIVIITFTIQKLIVLGVLYISFSAKLKRREIIKNSRDNSNTPTIQRMITTDDISNLEEYIKDGGDINLRTNLGDTPLILASEKGDLETVLMLLKHGADPLIRNNSGKTARDFALALGHKSIEEELKKCERDLALAKKKYHENSRAFRDAILSNDKDLAMELLAAEETVIESKDKYGNTPLFLCATNDNPDMFNFLIENGANINHVNEAGETVSSIAKKNKSTAITNILNKIRIAKDIAKHKEALDNGEDINRKNKLGDTPLILAAEKGDLDTVLWLLENGADPRLTNNSGQTARYFAETRGHKEIEDIIRKYEQ